MISLYIPKGTVGTLDFIKKEQATASNIKDRVNRTSVEEGLSKVASAIKKLDLNESGYKIFWDNENLRVEPYIGKIKEYFCGKRLLEIKDEYLGETLIFITIDANEVTIARVGESFEVLLHDESFVPGKVEGGGQSKVRYQHNRELMLNDWLKDNANKLMKLSGNYKIILGGPAVTKEKLVSYMNGDVKKRLIGIVDVGYTNINGIYDMINKSQELLRQCKFAEDKKLIEIFGKALAKTPELVTYGSKEFDTNNVDFILVNEKNKDIPNSRVVSDAMVEALGGICVMKKYKTWS